MKPERVRTLLAGGLLAVTIAAPRLARAEEPPPPRMLPDRTFPQDRSVPQDRGPESYGGQVVLTDLAAVGMLLVPVPFFKTVALATWMFGSPVIHLLHDRPGRAAGSLGLRLLLPVAGALGGAMLENCGNHRGESLCGAGGAILGGLAGILTASIVDAALLAGASEGNQPPPPLMRVAGVRLDYAGLAPERNGGGLVLGGRF